MWIFYVLPFLLSVASSQNSAEVSYLGGVPRLDNNSYMDYYFSCSTVGPSLDWQINEVTIFFLGNLSAGLVRPFFGANLTVFATLVSISHVENNIFSYYSIVVVTSTRRNVNVNLTVECFVDSASSITTNRVCDRTTNNSIISEPVGNILLQYLFPANAPDGALTHIYVCGVTDTSQGWIVNNSSPLLLGSTDPIGQNNQRLSADSALVAQKFLLISSSPFPISSVFFVTGPQPYDVSCASSQTNANINASQVIAALTPTPFPIMTTEEPMFFTEDNSTMMSNSTTDPTTIPTTNKTDTGPSNSSSCEQTCIILVVVIPGAGVPVIVVVAVAVGLGVRSKLKAMEIKRIHAQSGFTKDDNQQPEDTKLQDNVELQENTELQENNELLNINELQNSNELLD